MKQIAQNYKSGELALLEVPVPAARPVACWSARSSRSSPPAPR